MQLKLWGYEIQGEIANDIALLAENHKGGTMFSRHEWWDYTARDLALYRKHTMVDGQLVEVDVPEHWALPGVTELRIIREQAFYDIVKEMDL